MTSYVCCGVTVVTEGGAADMMKFCSGLTSALHFYLISFLLLLLTLFWRLINSCTLLLILNNFISFFLNDLRKLISFNKEEKH